MQKEKIIWTKHSIIKMREYRFSKRRVLRILRHPDRKETGIAPNTIANMQIAGTRKHPTEVWMMYQLVGTKNKNPKPKIKIISAWRYPGRTPKGEKPIIPQDTIDLLYDILNDC